VELFYTIADPDCAVARKAVVDRGLKSLVNFRNLHYPEVASDFTARGGVRLPALWDGVRLYQGLADVTAVLATLSPP
jgi:hypothetical protein